MGNICACSLSCDAIFSRCLDCAIRNTAYISKLENNLDALQTELQKLIQARNDVMRRVNNAERKQMKRTDQVTGWLSRVQALEDEVDDLQKVRSQEIEKLCLGGYCSKNCKSTYKFGEKVAEKLQYVANLRGEGDFRNVAEWTPEDAVKEICVEPAIIGQKTVFDQVWRFLVKKDVGIIGIFGKGGVGKTTLLKQINNRFCSERQGFDVVIWVEVSKELKLESIQDDIWNNIDMLTKAWKVKRVKDKAVDIFRILSTKKFVLLLDDLWEPIDLTKIGVPLSNRKNASKVVFTTRSEEVCGEMEAHKNLRVDCLTPQESWQVFQMKVGIDTLVSHPAIHKLAKMVAEECGGLPLALTTVGRAMACKKTPEEWKDAIEVLKRSAFRFPGINKVYSCLKFSFDRLPSNQIRSCFLFCSLFPEDYRIHKRDLVNYWIDEGIILDDDFDRNKATNRGYSIIGDLIRASLLEEEEDILVKMHDVVRDMALWIACEIEKREISFVQAGARLVEAPDVLKWLELRRMSLMNNQIKTLSNIPSCPHLLTLFLNDNYLQDIKNGFFQFMPGLKVLNLSYNRCLTKLPSGISKLVSLQHLDISFTSILELPEELKAFETLKYLDIDGTSYVRTVPPSLLSSFPMLQVLRMLQFGLIEKARHTSTGSDEDQGLMEDLLCLKHLNELSIDIWSFHALKRFLSSHKLQSCTRTLCLRQFMDSKSLSTSYLANLEILHTLNMSSCEFKELEIESASQTQHIREIPGFLSLHRVCIARCHRLSDLTWLTLVPNLKIVEVSKCSNVQEIINVEKFGEVQKMMGNQVPFSKLEGLQLENLLVLTSIYYTSLPFPNLKKIRVISCSRLKKLPLNSNSAKEGRLDIEGLESWWQCLEWEDRDTQKAFSSCFKVIDDKFLWESAAEGFFDDD